jgi:hypothetical protein
MFWFMQDGGIVDPATYKHSLIIKINGDRVKIKFGNRNKQYVFKTIDSANGQKLFLTKKQ